MVDLNQTMGFFSSKKLDKSDAFNAKLMKDDKSYQSAVNKAKIAYRFGNDKSWETVFGDLFNGKY
jgi:hypothetical protein